MNSEQPLQKPVTSAAPKPVPLAPSFLSVCFGSSLKIFDIVAAPFVWILLSLAWTRMLKIDQDDESVNTVLLKYVPFMIQLLITCVIFVPGFVRAGFWKGLLAFLVVNYVRFNIANVYALIFARSLEPEGE
eukprot:jgi/Mesvir1/26698/Mv20476-RA.1